MTCHNTGLYIIFAELPRCRLTDILYINIINATLFALIRHSPSERYVLPKRVKINQKFLKRLHWAVKRIPWCIYYYYHYYYQHRPYQNRIVRDVILSFISTVNHHHWQLKVWGKLFTVHRILCDQSDGKVLTCILIKNFTADESIVRAFLAFVI